jgi:transglutaminase-like putative cysteine protease
MRFSLVHKLASYLMVAAAFAATATSGELSAVVSVGALVLGPLSWLWEPPRVRLQRYEAVWNLATAGCFLYVVVDFLRPDGTLLSSGVTLLVFLMVNKLFNRRTSKDYLQLYVISFLLLVAGTTLNTDLSYAACFLGYVVAATWALTLFHLRREMEENYLLKHSGDEQSEKVEVERILNSRRIVGGSFLVGTSAVSLLVFLGALGIFFLFPRVGMGFFFARQRRGQTLSGFSERVDLGMHGAIKDNPQVVMRIEFPGTPAERTRDLHLRGIAFDHYGLGGQWAHTHMSRRPLPMGFGASIAPGAGPGEPGELEQQIYLEPLSSRVLFGATRMVALELPLAPIVDRPRAALLAGDEDEVYTATDRPAGIRYTVHSATRPPPGAELVRVPDQAPTPEMARYLQLPAGLSPRVGELARQITGNAAGPYRKALLVRDYLSRYRYTTLIRPPRSGDPLADFLFDTRAGHCEYFATAMAILLREVGVPTREVNGFYGGEWNDFGKYLAVRQMDAHSWVEVWLGEHHWVAFDPTPGGPGGARGSGWYDKLRQLEDSIELAWYKHMVEYNLDQQVELARGLSRWSRRVALPQMAVLRRPLLVGGALCGLPLLALWLWRRRRPPGRARLAPMQRPVVEFYQRVLRRCARAGEKRRDTESPREFARRLFESRFPGAELVARATELFYRVRFGGQAPPAEELAALDEKLDQIGHAT